MKTNCFEILLIVLITFLFNLSINALASEPLLLLIQPQGNVSYSVDGNTWKSLYRNQFLYNGYHVKTDNTGTCKLLDKQTNMIQPVENNTEVKINENEIILIKGILPEAESTGNLMGFFQRKFAKVQKYTAIKRHSKPDSKIKLKTVKNITLSDTYPDIVWENWGPEYSYKLIVDTHIFDVDSGTGDIIRFKLKNMSPGEFDYHVKVLYNGEIFYTPENRGRIKWLSNDENKAFKEKELRVNEIDDDNGFLLGNIMDEHGLKVAAMDRFQQFLSKNPDINEARPFLIKIYSDLKLTKLKQAEIILYHKNIALKN